MLRCAKAKFGIIILSILVLRGSTIGVMNAFADPNWPDMYYIIESSEVVELDGTNAGEFSISVVPINEDVLIHSFGGTFPVHNPYITAVECGAEKSSSLTREDCDAPTGNFYSEYDGYTLFELDEPFFTIHFTVSPDAPAGKYDIPIHFYLLQAQDINDGSAIDENMMNLYSVPQITVKRPQEVEFKNGYLETIPEINEYYGTPFFTLYRSVVEGDGEILDVYEKNNGEDEGVVHVGPSGFSDRNYVTFEKAGDVEICALVEETEYYLETESCIPVHISKRTRPIESVTVADKEYDGTVDGEIGGIEFEWADLYKDITSDDYEAYVTLDDPNVGNTMATVEIYLTEEAEKRFIIPNNTFRVPARVLPADVSDIVTAGIAPQEYDPSVDYQPVLAEVTIPISDFDYLYLEEGVDYELLYNGYKLYDEIWLTDAGDYNITISPLQGSNYTFEPFEATFTIFPRALTIYEVDVDEKEFDNNYDASVSRVLFNEAELEIYTDYEASAVFESSSAGRWRALVDINLTNPNYGFVDEYNPGSFTNQTSYEASDVEIYPRELKPWPDSTFIFLDDDGYGRYDYTGEEVKPLVYIASRLNDNDNPEDFYPLTLGVDYIVQYPEDTISPGGTGLVAIGIGNFCGSLALEYTVNQGSVEDVQITTPNQTYTGEALEPEPVVTAIFNGDRITIPANNYNIIHQDSFVDVGSYTYDVQESSTSHFHLSTYESTFTITPYEISSSDISLGESTYKYDGNSHTPSVTVTVGNTTIDSDDYEVEYSADTIGNDETDTTVTVTVTAKENVNITGSATSTYTITPRDVLTIGGIEDNQQIEYTGSPVVLDGSVMVEENEGGITAEDLTVTWYASDGTTVIDQPTNAGAYKVVYSYEDAACRGSLVVNFEITKASSPSPAEMTADFRVNSGLTLADIEGTRTVGFAWNDSSTVITAGDNVYPATYTYNNDTVNYETISLNVPVFGIRVIPTYEVIEGAGLVYTIGEGNDATFRVNADYALFSAVYVDDELVDPSNYTSWDGSTYVKLADDYMSTLAVGTHTLKITFSDDGSATTTFTIAKAESPDDDGDDNSDGAEEEERQKSAAAPDSGSSTVPHDGGTTATIGTLIVAFITFAAICKIRRKL